MTPKSAILLEWQRAVEPHLERIEAKLPEGAKLTLVVRMPWLDDGDIIMTIDDLEAVEAAIRDHRKRGEDR